MATIDTYSGTPANSVRIGDTSTNTYNAQSFQATADGTIETLEWFQRSEQGTPSDGITVEIWTDNSGSPNSIISGATENISQASIVDGDNSWSDTEGTTVTFSSPASVSNGTTYWVVVYRQGSLDGSNYNNWWTTSPSTYANGLWKRSSDGSSWNDAGGTALDGVLSITITEDSSDNALSICNF